MNMDPNRCENAPTGRARCWLGVGIGLVLPTAVTWGHFVGAAGLSAGGKQAAYVAMQVVQFGFPVVWLLWIQRERLRLGWPRRAGIGLGLVSGLAVAVVMWLLYDELLRATPFFAAAAGRIREKILSFGLDNVWRYAAFGLFYSLVHSALEEYYWRWFVFRQLRRLLARWPAIWISAFGFMLHHVVLVGTFFGWHPWATVLLSLSVPVAGVFWAWLYDRSGSLLGPWLSHLLVDVGIIVVGYDLVRSLLVGA
jgi:membrane protease YdiL (CAAX protease family)